MRMDLTAMATVKRPPQIPHSTSLRAGSSGMTTKKDKANADPVQRNTLEVVNSVGSED